MELKPNMYIRTKGGKIAKYRGYEIDEDGCKLHNFDNEVYWFYEYWDDCVCEEDFKELLEECVVKASNNIIDLIEVGDYVNGCKVKCISGYIELDCFGYSEYFIELDEVEKIKTIVTKEMYESMEYKIGG
jgi:hypothetical protein